MKRAVLGLCALAFLAVPLHAQAQERAFIRGFFGATFGQVGGGAAGAGFGVMAGKTLQITGEFGRLSNVIPRTVADEIDRNAAVVASTVTQGGKASSGSSATANYGLFGIRGNIHSINGGMAYIEGGAGMANVKSHVTAAYRSLTTQGDITSQVTTAFTRGTPETKPVVMLGAGMALGIAGRTAVEIGYRFETIMTTGTKINTSKFFGALRVGI